MTRTVLKSKIHRATVTEANVEYEGSVSIDADLNDQRRSIDVTLRELRRINEDAFIGDCRLALCVSSRHLLVPRRKLLRKCMTMLRDGSGVGAGNDAGAKGR